MRNWQVAVLLAAVAILAAVAVKRYSGYSLDDAYIGYRYAENIADGTGFVYNPGERGLGTTTPLFILVLAGLSFLGAEIQAASFVIGTLAFAGTVVLAWSLARRLGAGDLVSFFLGLGIAGFPASLRSAICGMETSVYALLTLLLMHLYLSERMRLFAVFGAVLFLVRPDGALLLAAIGLFDLVLRGGRVREWVKYAAIVVALSLPWLLFSQIYFGMLLPNSGFAKLLQVEDWGHFSKLAVQTLHLVSPLLLLILLGFVDGIVRDRAALLPGLYVLFHFSAFSALSFPACPWYLGPVYAPLLITAALGAGLLLRTVHTARGWVWLALGLVVLYQYSSAPGEVRDLKRRAVWMDGHHGEIGRWLGANSAEDASVAVDNIGLIGYYSRRRIIDVTGLIQNEVLKGIRRTGDLMYAIKTHRPEYIATQTRSSGPKYTPSPEWLAEAGYRLVFFVPQGRKDAYQIWKRADPAGGR